MQHTITLTEEQEEALAQCDFTVQEMIDQRLAPVIESLRVKRALVTYDIIQSDSELQARVETLSAASIRVIVPELN